jgi:ankyrin repeat protein
MNNSSQEEIDRFVAAAAAGHIGALPELVKRDPGIVNSKDSNDWTALMKAAVKGHKYTLSFLLGLGASVDEKDGEGMTALMYAAMRGHTRIAELLIEAGASVMNTSRSGMTPLLLAVSFGHQETAELLLDHGSDIRGKSASGMTALMTARERGTPEMIWMLEHWQEMTDECHNARIKADDAAQLAPGLKQDMPYRGPFRPKPPSL